MATSSNSDAEISQLDQRRRECEHDGLYREAHALRIELEQAKVAAKHRNEAELRHQQAAELQALQQARDEEFRELASEWRRKMLEFDDDIRHLQDSLKTQQVADIQQVTLELQLKRQRMKPKLSGQLLAMQKRQTILAKQQMYLEADQLQAECEALAAEEIRQWNAACASKMEVQIRQYRDKQGLEMTGLLRRIASGRQERVLAHSRAEEQLRKRYDNLMRDVETRHKVQNNKVNRSDFMPPSRSRDGRSVLRSSSSRIGSVPSRLHVAA